MHDVDSGTLYTADTRDSRQPVMGRCAHLIAYLYLKASNYTFGSAAGPEG
jgi:hypothetical protein